MTADLKNVKLVPSLSEETLCFTASLYIDGEKYGTVSNRGHGGPHEYSDRRAVTLLSAHAASLPRRSWEFDTEGFQPSMDTIIDDLLLRVEIRAELVKAMKKRVLVIAPDGSIQQTKPLMTPTAVAHVTDLYVKKGHLVLNALPLAEAVQYYIEAAEKN